MTARRLTGSAVKAPRFSVVGKCTAEDAVSHAGLLASSRELIDGQDVEVFHMAGVPRGVELPGTMAAHAVGWLVDLTDEDHSRLEDWVGCLKTEPIQIKYMGFPSLEIERDEVTGIPVERRFSCAGFVVACFGEALKVELVVDEKELPEVPLEMLKKVWPPVATPRGQRYLRGTGPWRVLLPSYLFHALVAGRDQMPHRPAHADPYFASRASCTR